LKKRRRGDILPRRLVSVDAKLWKIFGGARVFLVFSSYCFGELYDCINLVIRLWYVHELYLYAY
jgi:hypothetical protein